MKISHETNCWFSAGTSWRTSSSRGAAHSTRTARTGTYDVVQKLMIFTLKMMDFAPKMKIFTLKLMDCVLQMVVLSGTRCGARRRTSRITITHGLWCWIWCALLSYYTLNEDSAAENEDSSLKNDDFGATRWVDGLTIRDIAVRRPGKNHGFRVRDGGICIGNHEFCIQNDEFCILNAGYWTIHPTFSNNVAVINNSIITTGSNTDGCDPDRCF